MNQRVIVLSDEAVAFANTPAIMPVVEDIYSIRSSRTDWFVVYTEANREAKAIAGLNEIGVTSFFPKTVEWKPRTRAERDRKKPMEAVERPLLSRYLFVELPAAHEAFGRVLQVDGVRDILGTGEAKIPVPRSFIDLLRDREDAGEFNKTVKHGRYVKPKWVEEGCQVRITDGPFSGLVGMIQKCLARSTVEIALSILGRDTNVRLALAQVEKSW